MNELLKINFETEQPTVSARDLHDGLEIGTRFNDWFPRMVEYGFESGKDFNLLKNEQVQIEGNREVKREVTDYQISVDMAKQICIRDCNPSNRTFQTNLSIRRPRSRSGSLSGDNSSGQCIGRTGGISTKRHQGNPG